MMLKYLFCLETKNHLTVSNLVAVSPIYHAIRIKFFCVCVCVCGRLLDFRQQKVAETENNNIGSNTKKHR